MIVRVPASSANLGPGFDVLGVALGMHATLGLWADGECPDGARKVTADHPAAAAFARSGGRGEIWVHPGIPMGRGLGFSGAMRVGGVVLAHVQQHGPDRSALLAARPSLLVAAADLEGHADNAAASLYGGVVAVAPREDASIQIPVVEVPLGAELSLVVWVPPTTTRTASSRAQLATEVDRADAVFNVGCAALLVAALAAGDLEMLRAGARDRLHQDQRLAKQPQSRVAMNAALDAGAWSAWLSGSGPSVASFCSPAWAAHIAGSLPATGRAHVLQIDHDGPVILSAAS